MIIQGLCEHCGNRDQDTQFCTIEGCPHKGADPATTEGQGYGEAQAQTKGEAPPGETPAAAE